VSKQVSILIPAFNAGKWIRETIRSALGQTWLDKEIIVVDDGSTDRTLEIAGSFESGQVKVVAQDHRGAAAARNHALRLASGGFLQWLDADDLLAPDKIARQMEASAAERSDLILFSSSFGKFYHRVKKARFVQNDLWRDLSPADWLVSSLSKTLWMNPAVWLISRRLAEKAGPWDERLSTDDDGEYIARVVAASERVRFVPESKCYYRQSGFRQLSRSRSDEAERSRVLAAELKIQTLLRIEDSERARSAALSALQALASGLYPERAALPKRINEIAVKLGGGLTPGHRNWRLRILQSVFGPQRGRAISVALRRIRLAGVIKWDEIMDRFGR
jgi:glycosyltransferase involved in cell wall biosynthesis